MINVENLPTPDALTIPTYDELLAENIALFKSLHTDWEPHPSDENSMLLEAQAYRELMLYQQFNNKIKSLLLLYAKGSDLDGKAGDFNQERLDGETDEAFLERVLMSWDGYSTAGALGSYEYHARSVSSRIQSVQAYSPEKGKIHVAIATFTKDEDGLLLSLDDVLPQVELKLSDKKMRPVAERCSSFIAKDNHETICADITIENETEIKAIAETIQTNFALNLTVGTSLPYSKLIKYLEVDGVHKVVPTSHDGDITCPDGEIIRIDLVDITFFNINGDILSYE